MGLQLAGQRSFGILIIGRKNLQQTCLWIACFALVITAITQIPVPPVSADYNTFAQAPSSTIGTRTTYNGSPGLAFDSAGNSYFSVAGSGEDFIRVISPTNTFVRDITPYEPNLAYGQFGPSITLSTIAVDSSNNVYAAVGGNRIQKLTSDGTYIRTIGGAGSGDGQFGTIGQMATDSSDNLYVVDKTANRIQKFDSSGNFLLKFGSLGSGDSQFNQIVDLEVDPSDNLFVADGNNKRVKKFNSSGTFLLKFGAVNTSAFSCPVFPSFNTLKSVTIDSSGAVYVGAYPGNIFCTIFVQKFDASGNYLGNFSLLSQPSLVKMNRAQNQLYSQEIRTYSLLSRYTSTGTYVDDIGYRFAAGNFLSESTYIQDRITQDSDGNTYIIDSDGNYRIQKFDNTGAYVSSFGAFGTGDGQFRRITSVAISPSGQLYVADILRHDIQVFSTSGTFITKFGSSGSGDGQFANNGPGRMQFATNGDLYVSNDATGLSSSSRIIVFDSTNVFKKNITSYQQNGQTVNLGSTIYNFTLTSNDTLVILKSGSPQKLLRIDSNGVFINEKSLLNLIGENANHKFYNSTSRLYVDRNDTIYLAGTETNSPQTSLLQRPILAAINLDIPGIPDFRYTKSLGGTQDAIYFSATNSLQQWSARFNYLSIYDTTGTVYSPGTPQNFTANSPSKGRIDASWDPPLSDNGSIVVGYRVEYKPSANTSWQVHSTTSTTNVSLIQLLTNNYDIRVSALNDGGHSIPISQNTIAVQGITLPSAPLNLTVATPANGQLQLNWSAPSDNGGEAIATYTVEYKPHAYGQWVSTDSVSTTSTLIKGLTDDLYDIRIKANNSAGGGAYAEHFNTAVHASYAYKSLITTNGNSQVQGIVFDNTGKRYDIDYYYDEIDVYAADGTYERSFSSSGDDPGELYSARNLAISSDQKLYVADYGNNRVSIFNLDGTYVSSFGNYGSGDGEMEYPTQVYIDSHDNVYVVSEYANIQKYDKDGAFISRIATNAPSPTSMVIDADENLYVANISYETDHGIIKYDSSGNNLLTIGSEGENDGEFYEVYTMAINPDGNLVVNDTYNYRILMFDTDGQYLSSIGQGEGDEGEFLKIDNAIAMSQAANGDLYIANAYSPYIQVLSHVIASNPVTTAPSAPQTATAEVNVPNKIKVKWTTPADDGGNPITTYKIEHKKSSESTSSWIATIVDGSVREYVIDNAQAGCHDIQISAGNENGYGAPTILSCINVADAEPNPPTEPTPTPVPVPDSTPSLVIMPPTHSSSTTSTPSDNTSPETASSEDEVTPDYQTVTISPIEDSAAPGQITINWQPPQSGSVANYVIEYQLAGDASNTWRTITTATTDKRSATITLPEGAYTIRVAAVLAGETPTRVILGIAKVTIAPQAIEGDASGIAAAAISESMDNTLRNWIIGCAGSVMAASMFILLITWKRRRKKAQSTTVKLPSRRL